MRRDLIFLEGKSNRSSSSSNSRRKKIKDQYICN